MRVIFLRPVRPLLSKLPLPSLAGVGTRVPDAMPSRMFAAASQRNAPFCITSLNETRNGGTALAWVGCRASFTAQAETSESRPVAPQARPRVLRISGSTARS